MQRQLRAFAGRGCGPHEWQAIRIVLDKYLLTSRIAARLLAQSASLGCYVGVVMLWGLPYRVRSSSLGVYLRFARSSLRERLSCSLRLSPLPLHGYPCGLLPLIPLLRFPSRYSCTQRTDNPPARWPPSPILALLKVNAKYLELLSKDVAVQ